MCASCQLPQNKVYRYLHNPLAIGIALISLLISGYSLHLTKNPPAAEPKLGSHVLDYDDDAFSLLIYNYGEAPTFLMSLELNISLHQRGTTHEAHAYYSLNDPTLIPAESEETVSINYASSIPEYRSWNTSGGQEVFSLSFLYGAAAMGNNLSCEITLWYSASDTTRHRASAHSMSNGNCVSAMKWLALEAGPHHLFDDQ